MTCLKITACLLSAAAVMCAAVGCSSGEGNNNNSDINNSNSENVSSADSVDSLDVTDGTDSSDNTDSTDTDSDSDSSQTAEYTAGENLAAAVKLFDGKYTYKVNVTYSDEKGETEILQTSDGENFFQSSVQKNTDGGIAADTAYYFDGTNAYSIDYNLNVYSPCDIKTDLNLFEYIVSSELEQTSTHIPDDTEGCDIEEYTYAGDTYMTVYDLYFKDGEIQKYTATFSVEGEDDIIETVTVLSIEEKSAESHFSSLTLDGLTDFSGMSEDTRLGFCQGVCATYHISTDNMDELGITTDDLKRIDFDSFRELVYTYGTL
jgi:hypothetical protein